MLTTIILVVVVTAAAITAVGELSNKKYSYVCLKANDNLCFGVSPGPKAIEEPLDLQLKLRIRNENNGLDVFKTRYDVVLNVTGTFTSSANSKYCIQRTGKKNRVQVREGQCNTRDAFFNNTKLLENKEMSGVIQHVGTKLCLTVMRCDLIFNNGKRYCDRSVNTPERSDEFTDTSYIRLWPCFFNPTRGNLLDIPAQIFRNRLDCSPGCTVNMQGDGNCDTPCANDICEKDGGDCLTNSPTPPTRSPTNSPSFSPTTNPSANPTIAPTSNPSRNPTYHPTNNPTRIPSRAPSSSPSHRPSRSPSFSPSTSPSISPTFHVPTSNPSRSPSSNPTISPTTTLAAAATFPWWWIVIGVLILLCCCCCVVKQRRPKKETHSGYEEEPDIEVVETIKHEETPPASPTPPVTPPFVPETPIREYDVLPRRVIRKEVDSTGENYTQTEIYKEVKGKIEKTVSFKRQEKVEYKEQDVSADNLDAVVEELKSLKKT